MRLYYFPDKSCRCAACYCNGHVLSRAGVLTVEDYDFVLAVAAEQLFVGTMGYTFDQYFIGFSYLFLVVFQRYLPLQCNNLLKAPCFRFVGNIVFEMLFGVSVGTHRELEHIGVVVSYLTEHVESRLMVLFGLRAETCDNISCYAACGQNAVYGLDAAEVPFRSVVAVHQF